MQVISTYTEYLDKLNNALLSEECVHLQQQLNTLFERDKSELISYQKITEMLFNYIRSTEISPIKIESMIKKWDENLAQFRSLNMMIELVNKYGTHISHQTLKLVHYIHQTMEITDLSSSQKMLLAYLQRDLSHLAIDFSQCLLPSQKQEKTVVKEVIKPEITQSAKQEIKQPKKTVQPKQIITPQHHKPLNTHLETEKKYCMDCDKSYPITYTVCLRCGNNLISKKI